MKEYELADVRNAPQREVQPGLRALAKPVPPPLFKDMLDRVCAAWSVLRGRACAVRWY